MIDQKRDGFIQELRGVAVVLVVIYHFFKDLMPLGYLGVDLFFSISGFVITSSLVAKGDYGVGGVGRFYFRRVMRLLPSLNLVIFVTLLAVGFWFSPKLQRAVAIESVAAVFALSNVYFYTTIDYFSNSTILRPLLHTWSLGLEEQVYLFFPILVAAILSLQSKSKSNFLMASLVFLSLASLASFIFYNLSGNSSLAFYSPLSRFWQFGVGALVALAGLRSRWSYLLGGGGYSNHLVIFLLPIAILICGWQTDNSSDTSYLFSCAVSLTAVLLFTLSSKTSNFRWLRLVGDRSYALYLWHWPIYVLLNYIDSYIFPLHVSLMSILLTGLLSEVTYRVFESDYQSRKHLGVTLLALMSLNALTAAYIFSSSVLSGNSNTSLKLRAPCLVSDDKNLAQRIEEGCITDESKPKSVYLWGSSHLAHYEPAMSNSLNTRPLNKLLTQGCPPLIGFGSKNCRVFNDEVLGYLEGKREGRVIIGANWENHEADRRFYESLGTVVDRLRASGLEVTLVGQIPTFAVDIPTYIHANPTTEYILTITSKDLHTKLREFAFRNNSSFIDVATNLCAESGCRIQADGQSLYEDATHLSEFGAAWVLKNVHL